MAFVMLSEVQSRPVRFIPTKYTWLDSMFGRGMPECAVQTLAGESGVGKSRLLLDLCGHWTKVGQRVYYCPNEVYPEQFLQWASKFSMDMTRLACAKDAERRTEVQVEDIYRFRPDVAIIDSVSMNKGFKTKCLEHMDVFKRCALDTGCHIILIAHMNQKGQVKGAGEAVYNADVVCRMHRIHDRDDMFYWIVQKNRYGASGGACVFRHLSKTGGIEIVTSTEDPRIVETLSRQMGREVSRQEARQMLLA